MHHRDLVRYLAHQRGLPHLGFTFGSAYGVIALLRSIMADDALVTRLASLSYVRANASSELVLADLGDRGQLRLHAWPDGETHARDVHDHRWDFRSWILRGGYTFEEYELTPGTAWYRRRYYSSGSADAFAMDRSERSGARCVRRGRAFEGSEYTLAADVLHRVTPNGRATISLFLRGPARRPWTNVLSERPLADGLVALERTTPLAYRLHLEAALRALVDRDRRAA